MLTRTQHKHLQPHCAIYKESAMCIVYFELKLGRHVVLPIHNPNDKLEPPQVTPCELCFLPKIAAANFTLKM